VSHRRRPGRRRSWRWGCFALNGVAFAAAAADGASAGRAGGRVIKGCCIRWLVGCGRRARARGLFFCLRLDFFSFGRRSPDRLAPQLEHFAFVAAAAASPPKTHSRTRPRQVQREQTYRPFTARLQCVFEEFYTNSSLSILVFCFDEFSVGELVI
jgi:hypothetical protein